MADVVAAASQEEAAMRVAAEEEALANFAQLLGNYLEWREKWNIKNTHLSELAWLKENCHISPQSIKRIFDKFHSTLDDDVDDDGIYYDIEKDVII